MKEWFFGITQKNLSARKNFKAYLPVEKVLSEKI